MSSSSDEPLFVDIDQLIHQLFDKLVYRRWSLKSPHAWEPPVDIFEGKDSYVVEIDLPDVPPADVRFMVTERSLRIRGERRQRGVEGARLGQAERRRGTFHREIVFREPVDPERVRAAYQHGTYRLHIPKRAAAAVRSSLNVQFEWEVHVRSEKEGNGGNG